MAAGDGGDPEVRVLQTLRGKIYPPLKMLYQGLGYPNEWGKLWLKRKGKSLKIKHKHLPCGEETGKPTFICSAE